MAPLEQLIGGIGCTYPTQKLVIAQFGFAAEAPMYGSVPRPLLIRDICV